MPRVVHLTTVHQPYDQRIFHRECLSLANSGYHVTLVACGDIKGCCGGVNLVSLGYGDKRKMGVNAWSRWRRTRKALNTAIGLNADIYHFHDPELIGSGIALVKKTNACVIYDCHEDNVSYMLQKKYIYPPIRKMMAAFIRIQENRAVRLLDAIVTADEGMRRQFHKQGAKRVVTVENFPKLDLFKAPSDPTEKKFDIVYHGTLPKYHLETCFDVDTALVDLGLKPSWLFIGKCADIQWARSMVKRKGAADRFTFQGPVPHEQIAGWVCRGRIGIIPLPDYPKFHRNIPTKLFEFLALKMPVVLSDLPPSRPYVGDGKCAIMVDPKSPVAYAEAIYKLLKNPGLRKEMGHEGSKRVHLKYNWDRAFFPMSKLYQELLLAEN